jgi:hypothetical protein
MNRQAFGLSALGFLLFTAPAFAEEKTKTESKEEQDIGKKGSSYKSEKATKSSDAMKSATDEGKLEKSTKTEMKSGTNTELTPTTRQPGSDEKATKAKKTETESSSTAKPEKTKD